MADAILAPEVEARPRRQALRTFLANRPAAIGAVVALVIVLVAILAPLLTPYQPLREAGKPLTAPSLGHPFGTDDLARDVLSEVLYGARASLVIGFTASVIATVVGVAVGAVAGFFGGLVDEALMRCTEVFQIIPRIFLVILLVALFGQNLLVTTISIGILSWPPIARVLRAEFLSRREAEYVLAARVIGASKLHLIVREVLPNAIGPVIVIASLNVGNAILLDASLAFLGLSDPNLPSLGRMLQSALTLIQSAWWVGVFPGAVVALLVLATNLIGDGISDVLNPRLHR
ncbi:MAG: ABC transporter permease [Candidatus Dormiibacterota bacterium]